MRAIRVLVSSIFIVMAVSMTHADQMVPKAKDVFSSHLTDRVDMGIVEAECACIRKSAPYFVRVLWKDPLPEEAALPVIVDGRTIVALFTVRGANTSSTCSTQCPTSAYKPLVPNQCVRFQTVTYTSSPAGYRRADGQQFIVPSWAMCP